MTRDCPLKTVLHHTINRYDTIASFFIRHHGNPSCKMQTDVVIVYFTKAFDNVAHQICIQKLKKYGIAGPVNSETHLEDIKQCVVCEDDYWVPVIS